MKELSRLGFIKMVEARQVADAIRDKLAANPAKRLPDNNEIYKAVGGIL